MKPIDSELLEVIEQLDYRSQVKLIEYIRILLGKRELELEKIGQCKILEFQHKTKMPSRRQPN